MQRSRHPRFMAVLLGVVAADYLAQIPYYLHLYYPHPAPLLGSLLLGATLVWFLIGYVLLARGALFGYGLVLSYLVALVAFYLHNIVIQLVGGLNPLFFLQDRDPLVGVVLAIGHVTMLAGISFLAFLPRYRTTLVGATQESSQCVLPK